MFDVFDKQQRRRLPWYCIGHSVRVCPSCQHVIVSGEYEKGIVQRHQQRVADIRSIVQGPEPVPANAHLKEDGHLLARAVESGVFDDASSPATASTEATAVREGHSGYSSSNKHPNQQLM